MNREHLANTLSAIFVVGFLVMTALGNALALMIYGIVGLIVCAAVFPIIKWKAIFTIAAISGVIAFAVAFAIGFWS